jgi:hypothetical protein
MNAIAAEDNKSEHRGMQFAARLKKPLDAGIVGVGDLGGCLPTQQYVVRVVAAARDDGRYARAHIRYLTKKSCLSRSALEMSEVTERETINWVIVPGIPRRHNYAGHGVDRS